MRAMPWSRAHERSCLALTCVGTCGSIMVMAGPHRSGFLAMIVLINHNGLIRPSTAFLGVFQFEETETKHFNKILWTPRCG